MRKQSDGRAVTSNRRAEKVTELRQQSDRRAQKIKTDAKQQLESQHQAFDRRMGKLRLRHKLKVDKLLYEEKDLHDQLKSVLKAARATARNQEKQMRGLKRQADKVPRLESRLALVERCKRQRLVDGTWDGRKHLVDRLTQKQRCLVAKRWVNSRIYDCGYTAKTNKYNPQIICKFNTAMNTNKELLQTMWRWWLDEDSAPDRLQHRTTLSRIIKARSGCTLDLEHQKLNDASVTSFVALSDASERDSETNTAILVSYTGDGEVCAILWDNSIYAGKTGADMAKYLIQSFGPHLLPKWEGVSYDTTAANTGKQTGLKAVAERELDKQLFEVLCFLHSTALAQADFTTVLCGKTPRLQSGARCPPHAVALMLFQYFLHKRDWKEMKRLCRYLYNED